MKKPKIFIVVSLIGALVVFAGFLLMRGEAPAANKAVIDLSLPVKQGQDIVAKIDSPSGRQKLIQVKFFMEIGGYKYNDALYMTEAEYASTTPEKLEQIKMDRLKNWASLVNKQSSTQ